MGRLILNTFSDTPASWYWVKSEIHLDDVIKQAWRCHWRPLSSDLQEAFGNCDLGCSEIYLKVRNIEMLRFTSSPLSREIGEVLGGGWLLGGQLEVWWILWLNSIVRCLQRWKYIELTLLLSLHGELVSASRWVERYNSSRGYIQWLTWHCGNKRRLAVRQQILGGYCTQHILHLVYTVLGVCCTQYVLMIMTWRYKDGWLSLLCSGDDRGKDANKQFRIKLGIIWRSWRNVQHGRYNMPDWVYNSLNWYSCWLNTVS